jgi:ParB family chromosome partitioning protein
LPRGGAGRPSFRAHPHRRYRVRGREARGILAAAGKARATSACAIGAAREKVLFARKYRQLAETIESARARLTGAREREAVAAGRVAEVEADLGRLRIELVEADARSTQAREAAHARELSITRHEQQIAFDREQVQALGARTAGVAAELDGLEARREPARVALAGRRDAAAEASLERDRASAALAAESEAYDVARRELEGFEADVEAARGDVFSALNSATALRHALEHAAAARDRVAATLSKLEVETSDGRIESERAAAERAAAVDGPPGRRGDRVDADRARRARLRARQRGSSTNGARGRSARASTSWPGSRRG